MKIIDLHQPCPSCSSSDAFCRYEDGHGYCFSCTKYFPAKEDFIIEDKFTYEYLPTRGITKETFRLYDVKTKVDANGKPVSIGFKYPNGSYKVRSLETKDFHTKGDMTNAGLYGQDRFATSGHKYIAVTEGEFDACSLYQATKVPVVSVRSASSALRDCSDARSFLNAHDRIYLCFDSDPRGHDALHAVAKLFDYNKIYVLDFSPKKDANDYLQAGEEDVLRNIWWNAKPYLPENIICSFSEFKNILEHPQKVGIPYPFSTLTEMTYGLRTGESVLVTAQEGIGKTEFLRAIEFGLLRGTSDNIGAIFLEEPKARHLQGLAGLHIGSPVHIPGSGYSDTEIFDSLRQAIGEDERVHLYSHFGTGDPEVLLDCIRFLVTARNVRWVLLDHFSMACCGMASETDERRALDYFANRLELQIKELDYGLIMGCHVNDDGKTRGSRMPGKIADIRIDLSRDINNPDPIARNTLDLTVSKNRFGGKSGPAGQLFFDLNAFKFEEVVNQEERVDV